LGSWETAVAFLPIETRVPGIFFQRLAEFVTGDAGVFGHSSVGGALDCFCRHWARRFHAHGLRAAAHFPKQTGT
jgi:hypothetical protein